MEVLASYSHHQLPMGLSPDVPPRCLFGIDSGEDYTSLASVVDPTLASTVMNEPSCPEEDPVCEEGATPNESEVEDVKLSDGKEEADSDARIQESPVIAPNDKSPPKEKDRSQIAYLLSSLPALGQLFDLHRKIGEGTFSSVFLATLKNPPPKSLYAKKQFAVKHLIPTTHPTRAERELKCLQDIGGRDNVVGVHLCLRNQDNIAFIMPYLPHRRFSEYVMDMKVKETRNYMKNLLLALRRVHSFNIIHRDVKPSNFLYDRETKQFLLVDFGLSQPVEETSKAHLGSPVLGSNVRKRKREKECQETMKGMPSAEIMGNVAKRQALAPCNNTLHCMKTPEKINKIGLDSSLNDKSVPYFSSHRAKSLQNVSNIGAQKCGTTNTSLKKLLKSPFKEVNIENSHGKKTPRKKHFGNENAPVSPFKQEGGGQKKPFGLGGSEIWRDENLVHGLEKVALDLRKVKGESDMKNNGPPVLPRNPLQRKILFDDGPDEKLTANCLSMTPRRRLLAGQALGRHESPLGTPRPVSGLYGDSPAGSPILSLSDHNSISNNREFRTLVPERAKEVLPGSSIVRVQNSQVKSQELSPVTPSETRKLQPSKPIQDTNNQNVVFARPQAPASNGMHRSSVPSSPQCNCNGRPQVCTICLARKPNNAPRAGTPGFRPPEVLLRCPVQTTAVDMWAVGVILLCILSGCYPFFRSPDDLTALAEIMTVFGTDKIKETAIRLGRLVVCSQPSRALDLMKLCGRMRQRRKDRTASSSSTEDSQKCQNCCQRLCLPDGCICQKDPRDAREVNPRDLKNVEDSDDVFPETAYHLLSRLLDLNADTRITAAQALQHPFITELQDVSQ